MPLRHTQTLYVLHVATVSKREQGSDMSARRRSRTTPFVLSDDPLGYARALNPTILIVDVEPLLAPWRTDRKRLMIGLDLLSRAFDHEVRVIVATNSRRTVPPNHVPDGITYVSRARKPWRADWWPERRDGIVVIGDIPIIDGLLAWRLGALFVQVECGPGRVPLWPRLLVGLSRVAAPTFLRRYL